MEAIATEPRLMPHLHLSLQAGDDMILKRMKRRHLRDDAIAFCEEALKLRPDMTFGADIIAGFPTETDAMFENSLKTDRRLPPHLVARLSLFAATRHTRCAYAAGERQGHKVPRRRAPRQRQDCRLSPP